VTLVGFAGCDRERAALETLLVDKGIEPRLIPVPGVPTTAKLRILSGHQQMMRLDIEAGAAFAVDNYRQLLSHALAALDSCAAVVLSDYAKGTLTEEVCQSVIREARRRRIAVLVRPVWLKFDFWVPREAIAVNEGLSI